jgi:hypothetical protein
MNLDELIDGAAVSTTRWNASGSQQRLAAGRRALEHHVLATVRPRRTGI